VEVHFEIAAEDIAVACALILLIVVGIWVRWRGSKGK
jgi:hypothetical protein